MPRQLSPFEIATPYALFNVTFADRQDRCGCAPNSAKKKCNDYLIFLITTKEPKHRCKDALCIPYEKFKEKKKCKNLKGQVQLYILRI